MLAQEFQLFESATPWIAAALVLGAGLVIATVVAAVVNATARRLLGDPRTAGRIAGGTFWFVTVLAAVLALGRLAGPRTTQQGLSDAVRRFLVRVPDVLVALLVVVLGWVLAAALRAALRRALTRIQPTAAEVLAGIGYWATLVVAVLIAADQVGIQVRLLQAVVLLVVGALLLAAALAAGLGGRELAGEVLAARHVARLVAPGDEVAVGDVRGRVVALGHTSVRLATGDAEVEVPNRWFLAGPVTIHRAADRADRPAQPAPTPPAP